MWFVNKEGIENLWSLCIMLCSTLLSTKKWFKICGAYASCVFQQGSSLKVVVPMHHVFVNKEAVKKLGCLCIMRLPTSKEFKSRAFYASCFSTRKHKHRNFSSCGVYASSCYQQGSGVIVAMFMYNLIIKEVAVFKVSESWYVLYDRQKG